MEPAEAAREAELMLGAATGLKAAAIILKGNEPLADSVVAVLDGFIERRSRREPLQHILGESYFMGLRFAVNSSVLIPRPETELIVELARQIIDRDLGGQANILDIGAGSGAICLSLLKLCPAVRATAFEISPDAAEVCLLNAHALGVSGRLTVEIVDVLEVLGKGRTASGSPAERASTASGSPAERASTASGSPAERASTASGSPFDLILSNPPYIPPSLMPGLAPEVRDYEPRLALQGPDDDGLGFYRVFARGLPKLTTPGGAVLIAEFGEGQGADIVEIFELAKWLSVRLLPDLSGKDRILLAGWGRPTL